MTGTEIDRFLAGAERPWPANALGSIVAAIRAAGPFHEAIKWGHPYFSLDGHAVVKLYAARAWVNVFYYRGAELEDADGLLVGEGPSGMRRLRILREVDPPLTQIQSFTHAAAVLARE